MVLQDSELIRSYQNGDAEAFETLVRKYQRPLFTFLLRLAGNRQNAEDLFQDTFVRVLRALPNYKEDGCFSGWLFGIANNLAVDWLHRREVQRERFVDDDEALGSAVDYQSSTDATLERAELARLIENALQQLSEKQRQVFLLRQHSDLSFKEIAAQLGEPLNTVLSTLPFDRRSSILGRPQRLTKRRVKY
jgi:RNA polymerase sigma-70 factor (ECF subfamily)